VAWNPGTPTGLTDLCRTRPRTLDQALHHRPGMTVGEPMNTPSRRTLALAALALVASLVAVGRLATLDGPPASSGRPGAAPSVVKLGVCGPVDDVAHTIESIAGNRILEQIWILRDGLTWRVEPTAAGRPPSPGIGHARTGAGPADRHPGWGTGGDDGRRRAAGAGSPDRPGGRHRTDDTGARVASTVYFDVFAVCCGDTQPAVGGCCACSGLALPGW